MFCAEWLVEWMLQNQTWPHWRKGLNSSNVIKDREWRRFMTYLDAQTTKSNQPIWEKHQLQVSIYWTDWVWWIWSKCVTSKVHNGHDLIDYEDSLSHLQKIVDNELWDENSLLKDLYNNISNIENWRSVNERIIARVIQNLVEEIMRLGKDALTLNEEFYDSHKNRLQDNLEKWKSHENLLNFFKEINVLDFWDKASKSILDSKNLKFEIIKYKNSFKDEMKNIGLESLWNPKEIQI